MAHLLFFWLLLQRHILRGLLYSIYQEKKIIYQSLFGQIKVSSSNHTEPAVSTDALSNSALKLYDMPSLIGRVLVSLFLRSNFCKDHREKIEVPDPLVVDDLISVIVHH